MIIEKKWGEQKKYYIKILHPQRADSLLRDQEKATKKYSKTRSIIQVTRYYVMYLH